jgi:stage IV sporulation protein FB
MPLGEPQRTSGDLNFILFGVPVRIHPMFWLMALLLGYNLSDAASVAIWVAAVLLSILVHEFGHAAAMRAFGYYPWIVLYGFGGLACRDSGTRRQTNRWQWLEETLISVAGPAAGFLLAAVLLLALFSAGKGRFLDYYGPLELIPYVHLRAARFGQFLNFLFQVGVLWGLLNLLPIYPLDGGQIARQLLLKFSPRDGIAESLFLSIVVGAIVAIWFLRQQEWFAAVLFGSLAISSFHALRSYRGRGPW